MEFLLVNRKHNKYSSCHPSGNRQGCTAVLSIPLRCRLRSNLPVLVAAGLDCVFLQDRLHKKEQHRFCFINLFLLSKPQLVSTWNFKIPAIRCSTCQDTKLSWTHLAVMNTHRHTSVGVLGSNRISKQELI